MSAGDAIASARRAKGLSQQALAARLACSIGAVAAWEAGRRTPRAATMRTLMEELGIDARDLLGPAGPGR